MISAWWLSMVLPWSIWLGAVSYKVGYVGCIKTLRKVLGAERFASLLPVIIEDLTNRLNPK